MYRIHLNFPVKVFFFFYSLSSLCHSFPIDGSVHVHMLSHSAEQDIVSRRC